MSLESACPWSLWQQLTVVIKEAADWITAKQTDLPTSNVVAEYGNNSRDEF